MKMRPDNTKLVLFSPIIVFVDKLKAANSINYVSSGLFSGDPIMLPIPDDAPSEIPRMQMASKDGKHNLSIARNRLDLLFKYKEDEAEKLFPSPGLFETFLTIFNYLREDAHIQVTRCAIVSNWILELEKPGAEVILSSYVRSKTPIIKPYELELHYLAKRSIAGFDVNKWTRIKSARKINEPENNRFISFYIDINTLAEVTYEFNKESLHLFLDESSKVIKETIDEHLKNMEE